MATGEGMTILGLHAENVRRLLVSTDGGDGAFIIEDGSVVEGEPCNRS